MMMKSFLFGLSFIFVVVQSLKVDEYVANIRALSQDEKFLREFYAWSAKLHSYPNYPYGEKPGAFPCPLLSNSSPNDPITVDNFRPADVQCVAAIGDSLTAALGASAGTPIGLFTENRGKTNNQGKKQAH